MRLGWLILPIFCCGALLVWPFSDARGLNWHHRHVAIIQEQLVGLKDLLQAYRLEHGRYPSNDEGLAAVHPYFESRIPYDFHADDEILHRIRICGISSLSDSRFSPVVLGSSIAVFREQHGRAPTHLREVFSIHNDPELPDSPFEGSRPTRIVFGIDKGNRTYVLDDAGVMSPFYYPYMYENRTAAQPGQFVGSPIGSDWWGQYSLEVDDGVYVYSVGGKVAAGHYNASWWFRYGPRFVGGMVLLIFLVVFILRRIKRYGILLLTAFLGLGAGSIYGSIARMSCYVMVPLFAYRSRKTIEYQIQLLDKYRQQGVIAQSTYDKLIAAIEVKNLLQDSDQTAGQ